MPNIGSIFLGVTKQVFRKKIHQIIKHLKERYPIFVDPCVGNFAVPLIAAHAGVNPNSIITSDVGPLSYVMGKALSGSEFDDLGIIIQHDFWDIITENAPDKRPSFGEFILLIKCLTMQEHFSYHQMHLDDMLKNSASYAKKLKDSLETMKAALAGIIFIPQDMRKTITEYSKNEKALIYINPPAYAGGYEKLYDTRGAVLIPEIPPIEMFDWKKEFNTLEKSLQQAKAFTILYKIHELTKAEGPKSVFIKELKTGVAYDSLVVNRENEVPASVKNIKIKKSPPLKPLPFKVFNGEIKDESKVEMMFVKRENSLYYRNLWAHRLGETDSEQFTVWTIDGAIFATCAFHVRDLFRLVDDKIFESYGFATPHPKYPNLVRLLMLCLTSQEFKDRMMRSPRFKKMPYIIFNGLKTTCLSRYRKVKLNNGILDITLREFDDKVGMYRILYEAKFRPDTFQDCVMRYKTEWLTRMTNQQKESSSSTDTED